MKKTTLNEVKQWMRRMNIEEGCSIPMVVNGGGFSWITPSEDIDTILDGDGQIVPLFENYNEDVTILSKGEEFSDFKTCMGEEYDDMTFILVHHQTGYNQENFDIQIGVWDYDFENGIDKKDIIKLTWHAGNEEFYFTNLKSIYACFSTDDVGITWASLNNYGIKEGKPYVNKRCRIEKVQLLKAKKKKE